MKITTFNPQIITKNAEPIQRLFEELGFERQHTKTQIGEMDVTGIQLRDQNGFKLDISQPSSESSDILPAEAMVGIRINVDNFDEAYQLLTAHGFRNIYADKTAITPSARSAVMIAPSGFAINLVQHIKKM